MFRGLVVSALAFLADLSQHRSPCRVGAGLALGISIGFVPLDSLVAALLLVFVLFLPVNQLVAAAAWATTIFLSGYLSFVPDLIGGWLLSWDAVRWSVAQAHAIPLGAWLRLNNTLVMGGVAVGVLLLIPNWVLGRMLTQRLQQRWSAGLLDDMAREIAKYRKDYVAVKRLKAIRDATSVAVQTDPSSRGDVVVASSAEATLPDAKQWRLDSPSTLAVSDEGAPRSEPDGVTLRETFIEVVRLRSPQPHLAPPIPTDSDSMIVPTKTPVSHTPESESAASHEVASGPRINESAGAYSPARQALTGPKSANSLRFLIRHLASHGPSQDQTETRA